MKIYTYFLAICFVFLAQFSFSQDEPVVLEEEEELDYTFTGTRVINGHSVEMLPKKTWEFRIEHKFGDIAGTNGGVQTMFGFDNVTDMRIALEYGVTEKFMLGFGRCKGTGSPYRSLLDGFAKYNILKQKKSPRAFFNFFLLTNLRRCLRHHLHLLHLLLLLHQTL